MCDQLCSDERSKVFEFKMCEINDLSKNEVYNSTYSVFTVEAGKDRSLYNKSAHPKKYKGFTVSLWVAYIKIEIYYLCYQWNFSVNLKFKPMENFTMFFGVWVVIRMTHGYNLIICWLIFLNKLLLSMSFLLCDLYTFQKIIIKKRGTWSEHMNCVLCRRKDPNYDVHNLMRS